MRKAGFHLRFGTGAHLLRRLCLQIHPGPEAIRPQRHILVLDVGGLGDQHPASVDGLLVRLGKGRSSRPIDPIVLDPIVLSTQSSYRPNYPSTLFRGL